MGKGFSGPTQTSAAPPVVNHWAKFGMEVLSHIADLVWRKWSRSHEPFSMLTGPMECHIALSNILNVDQNKTKQNKKNKASYIH